MAKRNKDHDIFVRGILSFTALVEKLLRFMIPEDLKYYIDFSTLKMMPDSHITEKLRISYSDTIYEASLNLNALAEEVRNDPNLPEFRFCFLKEFKSSKPKEPIDFQIEDYSLSIKRHDLKNNRQPSIVIPILIYHGAEAWESKRLYDTFERYLPAKILEYIAYPKYLILDLQAMPDDAIKEAIGLGELRAAFLALKHAQDKKFFKHNLAEILSFVELSSPSVLFQTYLKMLMEYSQRRSGLDDDTFNKVIEQLNPDLEMASKTIFDRAEERAFARGEAQGEAKADQKVQEADQKVQEIAQKAQEAEQKAQEADQEAKRKIRKAIINLIQKTNMTDAQIAEIQEVELLFVQTIREELKGKKN